MAVRLYLRKPIWGVAQGEYLWLAIENGDQFPVFLLRPIEETLEEWKNRYQEVLLEALRVVKVLRQEEESGRGTSSKGLL